MRKVGPPSPLELLDGGLAEQDEAAQGEFDRALTEVRAVSGALDVCYGKGEVAETELPERPVPRSITPSGARPELPPIETEVESYLVGLDLPPPRAQRRRAASLLEQGKTVGEVADTSNAELKA